MQSQTAQKNQFASHPLTDQGSPADFVFRKMRDIQSSQKNKAHTPHRHQYYAIIWITRGEGTHLVDFKSYPAKANTIFFVSPEQVHDLQMHGPHDGFALLFTENFLEKQCIGNPWLQNTGFFFRCDDVAPLQLNMHDDHSPLLHTISSIEKEYTNKQKGAMEAIGSLLRYFLIQCTRLSGAGEQIRSERNRAGSFLVRQFKDTLDAHFQDWHKVADYASALHITPNYLNEIITQETGLSAKDMILARIILEAKRFATHSNVSVKEVAYQLGFTDPSHFSKLFKQIEKQGFTDFRSQIRKIYS